MRFPAPLLESRLVQRYKLFLAGIDLATVERVTAHCANPGAMLGLAAPGARVLLSRSTNPLRKLGYSWEFVEVMAGGVPPQRVGINTSRPNALVAEALAAVRLAPLAGYAQVRREVKYGRKAGSISCSKPPAGRPAIWGSRTSTSSAGRTSPSSPTASRRAAPSIWANSPTWSQPVPAQSWSM
jgi:DNA-binding sugar fermentation-stimulating protein